MSLHSPRPERTGDVNLGAGVGVGVFEGEISDALFMGTFRAGLFDQGELGVNAGTLGVETTLKYGFTAYENPFQTSVIGGLGLYSWEFFEVNAGLLVGYLIGDVVMPYGGLRMHYLIDAGLLNDGILGVEFVAGDLLSFMLEWNAAFSFESLTDLSAISTLSGGVSFHF